MSDLPKIPSLLGIQAKMSEAVGLREGVRREVLRTKKTILDLEREEKVLRMVTTLFRTLIDRAISEGLQSVEEIQTEGLQRVFHDLDLSVRAELDVQRGKVSVTLVTVQKREDGSVIEGDSYGSFGGSVTTVESILMRIIVLLRRGLRPVLFLDETFPALDENYVINVASFLRTLAEKLDLDILLVTHNPLLIEAAHRAYRVRRGPEGQATFRLIRGERENHRPDTPEAQAGEVQAPEQVA